MDKDAYRSQRSVLLSRAKAAQQSLGSGRWIFIFEGRDTAGKTGTLDRLVGTMEKSRVSSYHVTYPLYPEQGKAQKDLAFFEKLVPKPWMVLFFDRSWYTPIIANQVNKVKGKDWEKVYLQVNDFERRLSDDGVQICKFYMEISKEEQFTRLKQRQNDPKQRYKLTPQDWKAYWQYDKYTEANTAVLDATGTRWAPWYQIDMTDKWAGRLACMEIVAQLLENSKDTAKPNADTGNPPPVPINPDKVIPDPKIGSQPEDSATTVERTG